MLHVLDVPAHSARRNAAQLLRAEDASVVEPVCQQYKMGHARHQLATAAATAMLRPLMCQQKSQSELQTGAEEATKNICSNAGERQFLKVPVKRAHTKLFWEP